MDKRETGVTYLALQRLVERAWDEGDAQRLQALSLAMDEATIHLMEQGESNSMAG